MGRCWWRCREHPSISESCWTAASVVGPAPLWLGEAFGSCGTLSGLESLCSCHSRGQQWKSQARFHLPTPQMHSFTCLTSPSYPPKNGFHLFSLLCSNCFYTVSNAPQVPSIHNCCYLVKCFSLGQQTFISG